MFVPMEDGVDCVSCVMFLIEIFIFQALSNTEAFRTRFTVVLKCLNSKTFCEGFNDFCYTLREILLNHSEHCHANYSTDR